MPVSSSCSLNSIWPTEENKIRRPTWNIVYRSQAVHCETTNHSRELFLCSIQTLMRIYAISSSFSTARWYLTSLFSSSMIFRAILIWTPVFSRQRKCTFNSQLIVIFQHPSQEFSAYSVVRANHFSLHLAARTSRVKSTPNSRVERWTWTIHTFGKTPILHYLRSNEEQHQQHSTIFWQWDHWWSCNVENFTFLNFASVQKKLLLHSFGCLSFSRSFFSSTRANENKRTHWEHASSHHVHSRSMHFPPSVVSSQVLQLLWTGVPPSK